MSTPSGDHEPGPGDADAGAAIARPGTGLLLLPPPGLEPDRLQAALSGGGIVGVVVVPGDTQAAVLRALCREAGVACLIGGDASAVRGLDADGVHLEGAEGVRAARARLGPDAIIGSTIGLSRHAAMVAGEDGADYVMAAAGPVGPAVDADLAEFCIWWSELFVLPCAVDTRGRDLDLGRLVADGADFLGVQEAVWSVGDDPARAVRELRRVLARVQVESG